MYEYEIIEVEDYQFNHFIHHFEECSTDHVDFNDEFDCITAATECIEEILWR